MSTGPVSSLDPSDLDAVRRRMLNVVGHELRTPVTALTALARELKGADAEVVRHELGPAIERLATRTEQLVDSLLLAAGIRTLLPIVRGETSVLRTALDDAWSLVAAEVDGSSISVDDDGGSAPVAAPADTLLQMLTHLLLNAAAHGDGRVEVTIATDGPMCVAQISNRADGVGDDEVRLAAEAFYRGERAVTTRPGLGLGLTIASELADHYGGSATLSLHDGRATAELRLPNADD